jgi:hypothetical protein
MTRDALPFNNVSMLLSAMLFIIAWNLSRLLIVRRARGVSAIRGGAIVGQMPRRYPGRVVLTGGQL